MSPARRPRVVIVGASFAGLAAARRLPSTLAVTVVDPSPWFEFLPNIHELLSGVFTPELLRLPLDRNVRRAGHTFLRDTVTERSSMRSPCGAGCPAPCIAPTAPRGPSSGRR